MQSRMWRVVAVSLIALALLSCMGYLLGANDPIASCMGERYPQVCYAALVNNTYEDSGLVAAFDLVARLGADTFFSNNCHGNAHELGELAYADFRNGRDVEFTSKASYCGYGFYHGFMEKLIQETGDARRGRELCQNLGEELWSESVDTGGACFHGIGHGTVDGSDVAAWGDAKAIIAPALAMCRDVTEGLTPGIEGKGPLYRCITGAYNGLEILSQDRKYRLDILADDPFGFCSTEREEFRQACYTNMIPAVMRIERDDFPKVIAHIDAIPDSASRPGDRAYLVRDLLHEYIRLHGSDTDKGIDSGLALCGSTSAEYDISCIEGLSGGFLKYGEPKNEYKGMFELCTNGALTHEQAERCFTYGLSRLRNLYSEEKTRTICTMAPEAYRSVCS